MPREGTTLFDSLFSGSIFLRGLLSSASQRRPDPSIRIRAPSRPDSPVGSPSRVDPTPLCPGGTKDGGGDDDDDDDRDDRDDVQDIGVRVEEIDSAHDIPDNQSDVSDSLGGFTLFPAPDEGGGASHAGSVGDRVHGAAPNTASPSTEEGEGAWTSMEKASLVQALQRKWTGKLRSIISSKTSTRPDPWNVCTDYNFREPQGKVHLTQVNPLHLAARLGADRVAIQALLEAGADARRTCPGLGWNVLHFMCRYGSAAASVCALLDHASVPIGQPGRDLLLAPSVDGTREETPLHLAVAHGHSECVDAILNHRAITTEDRARAVCARTGPHRGCSTVLHLAIVRRDPALLSILLDHLDSNLPLQEQFVESQAARGPTHPLALAALIGNVEAVQALLQASCPIIEDAAGYHPLVCAARTGRNDIVELLLRHIFDVQEDLEAAYDALFVACANGHASCVASLLKWSQDQQCPLSPNASVSLDGKARTALQIAVYHGHASCVQVCMQYGGDLQVVSGYSYNCLHLLAMSRARTRDSVITFLREYCASQGKKFQSVMEILITKPGDYSTPFQEPSASAQKIQTDISTSVEGRHRWWRLMRDSDLPRQCDSAIGIAARRGHTDVMQFFTEIIRPKSMSQGLGYSPILLASRYGHRQVLERLHSFDSTGFTKAMQLEAWSSPLGRAVCGDHLQVTDFILSQYPDLSQLLQASERVQTHPSPLHHLIRRADIPYIRRVLDCRINPDIHVRNGPTALEMAKNNGLSDVIPLLERVSTTAPRGGAGGKKTRKSRKGGSKATSRGGLSHSLAPASSGSLASTLKSKATQHQREEQGHQHKQHASTGVSAGAGGNMIPRGPTRTAWRSVRLFVSSTFSDMLGERDEIMAKCLPPLINQASDNGIHLIPIDLRWGVTSEEARTGQSVPLCLDHASQCDIFVGMTGDRYGWVPDAKIGEEMARQYGFTYQAGMSLTHMEFEVALASRQARGWPRVMVLSRTGRWQSVAKGSKASYDTAIFQPHGDVKGVQSLQQRIKEAKDIAPTRLYTPDTIVDNRAVGLTQFASSFSSFVQDCLQSLKPPTDATSLTPQAVEAAAQESFRQTRFHSFIGRSKVMQTLSETASHCSTLITVVNAAAGYGKSALMSHLVTHLEGKRSRGSSIEHPAIVSHFVGASASSVSIRGMLHRLCLQLARIAEYSDPIPGDLKNLYAVFHKLLAAAAYRSRVVIVIDAVNQLNAPKGRTFQTWLDLTKIPAGVCFFISCIDGPVLSELTAGIKSQTSKVTSDRQALQQVTLGPLDKESSRELIATYLQRFRKSLNVSQMARLATKRDSNLPLYLVVACEHLRLFGDFDHLDKQIQDLPGTVPELLNHLLLRLEQLFSVELVARLLLLLLCARHGLTEYELVSILKYWEREPGVSVSEWPGLLGNLRMFLHASAGTPASTGGSGRNSNLADNRDGVLDFFHRQLAFAVRRRYLGEGFDEHTNLPCNSRQRDRLMKVRESIATFANRSYHIQRAQGLAVDQRTLAEIPYQYIHLQEWHDTQRVLSDLGYIAQRAQAGDAYGLLTDYDGALAAADNKSLQKSLSSYRRFVYSCMATVLIPSPHLTIQAAADFQESAEVRAQARSILLSPQWTQPYTLRVQSSDGAEQSDASDVVSHRVLHTANDWVVACAISPDGQYGVSLSRNGDVTVLNNKSGEPLVTSNHHQDGEATGVVFLSQGSDAHLLITGTDGRAVVTSARTGMALHTVTCGVGIGSVAKDPRCDLVVFALLDGRTSIYSYTGNSLVHVQDIGHARQTGNKVKAGSASQRTHRPCAITCLRTGSSGQYLVAEPGQDGRQVRVHLLQSQKNGQCYSVSLLSSFQAHSKPVQSLVFFGQSGTAGADSPVEFYGNIATVSHSDGCYVHQASHGKQLAQLSGHSNIVAAVTHCGPYVITAGWDKRILVFHGETFALIRELTGHHSHYVIALTAFHNTSANTVQAITGGHDKLCYHHSLSSIPSSLQQISSPKCQSRIKASSTGPGISHHTKLLSAVLFVPGHDQGRILTCAWDGAVKLWTADGLQTLSTVQVTNTRCGCMAVSSHGDEFVVGCSDFKLHIFSLDDDDTISLTRVLKGHNERIFSCHWSPDDAIIASGCVDSQIYLWDPETGKHHTTLEGHTDWVTGVAFSSDSRTLLSCSRDQSVRIWDLATKQARLTLQGHTAIIENIILSPDDSVVVSLGGTNDHSVRLWDVWSGQLIMTLTGHTHEVVYAQFWPDTHGGAPRYLLSVSSDCTAKLWDLHHPGRVVWQWHTSAQLMYCAVRRQSSNVSPNSSDHGTVTRVGVGDALGQLSVYDVRL